MLLLQWGADRVESQETMSIGQRQCGFGPEWEQWLFARLAPRHVSMCMSGPQRVSQIPQWVTKLTVSIEWDLFSHKGEYGQTSLIPVAVFSLLAAQERRSEPTQVVRPLWAFARRWNNLWQISDHSNRRSKRLQVSRPYGTPLKTSSMLEGDLPQGHNDICIHKNKLLHIYIFLRKVSENWGTFVGISKREHKTRFNWWQYQLVAYSKCNVGGSTSLWRTVTSLLVAVPACGVQ